MHLIYKIMFNIFDINTQIMYNYGMLNKKILGEQLKRKRLQMNMRMDDVAKKIGITRSTLWSIENGNGNYSIDVFLKLLNVLDLKADISSFEYDSDRNRATRTNSVLSKKINRFIVMCVEQYASSVNENSGLVYKKLETKGIIKELTDDYEDMHGMSTTYINEYINARL